MLNLPSEWIALLKEMEGFRAKPYKCPAGLWTQGYGRVVGRRDMPPITREQAEKWLVEDASRSWTEALKLSPTLADAAPLRHAAIADFIFNIGGAKYATSTLRKRVDSGYWEQAATENRLWVNARNPKTGKLEEQGGLVKRRDITSRWLRQGR